MMKPFSLLWAIVLTCHFAAISYAADIPLHGEMVVHFASVAEGQELLATKDRFISSLSAFDRQSRVETDKEVSEAAFIEFLQSHVRPWDDEETLKIAEAIESLRPKMSNFRLHFPKSIWLVKTTGREEGDAAYCRQHGIVLPQSKINDNSKALERLITHELFHVLSSHDARLREQTYRLIGFRVVPPIELPATLRDRKLTNPDGPLLDGVIDLAVEGATLQMVPVLYSSEPTFNPKKGGPFFKYLTFRLLAVEAIDGVWRAMEENGEPRLFVPNQVPDYGRQIGGNTQYIIHPDEIMADNFVHLVHGTPNLRSPEIVTKLKEIVTSDE